MQIIVPKKKDATPASAEGETTRRVSIDFILNVLEKIR